MEEELVVKTVEEAREKMVATLHQEWDHDSIVVRCNDIMTILESYDSVLNKSIQVGYYHFLTWLPAFAKEVCQKFIDEAFYLELTHDDCVDILSCILMILSPATNDDNTHGHNTHWYSHSPHIHKCLHPSLLGWLLLYPPLLG